MDVFLEELDSIEPGQLAAIVGCQQPPLSEGGSVRHPPLARLRALARASATVIGLLDSPDRVRTVLIASLGNIISGTAGGNQMTRTHGTSCSHLTHFLFSEPRTPLCLRTKLAYCPLLNVYGTLSE